MDDVTVIDNPTTATTALHPTRARLLAHLAQPRSATQLAADLGLPRQQVNYHLRALERAGLATLVAERRKGNVHERLLQASAAAYLISPAALAALAPDPARAPDRLSARWLLALAARLVADVGRLLRGAAGAGRPLATFALEGEVRFASAADRAAFTERLAAAVAGLVATYHDQASPGGRPHRLVLAIHPAITTGTGTETAGSDPKDS